MTKEKNSNIWVHNNKLMFCVIMAVIGINAVMGSIEDNQIKQMIADQWDNLPLSERTCIETQTTNIVVSASPIELGISCEDICHEMHHCLRLHPDKQYCEPDKLNNKIVDSVAYEFCVLNYRKGGQDAAEMEIVLQTPIVVIQEITNCTKYRVDWYETSNEYINETIYYVDYTLEAN